MGYQLEIKNNLGLVHLVYHGEVLAEERHRARDEVFAMCQQYRIHRSLVDMRDCLFRMSAADAVRFSREFELAKLPANYRLACILGPGEDHDAVVGPLISLNGVNIKYFHSEQDALAWLTAY